MLRKILALLFSILLLVGCVSTNAKKQTADVEKTTPKVVLGIERISEPEFSKLHASLGYAMLSINAAKGIEFGAGFDGVKMTGSQQNDAFCNDNGTIRTRTNNSGGIQGGISNGNDIYFRIAFKPIATLLKNQNTVDIHGTETTFKAHGRHDPCVPPRAVPIVESMAAMTVLDHYLLSKTTKL